MQLFDGIKDRGIFQVTPLLAVGGTMFWFRFSLLLKHPKMLAPVPCEVQNLCYIFFAFELVGAGRRMRLEPARVIDLFAGAGGLSLGFRMAGADVVAALEIDRWAAETYRFNHPNARVLETDITKVSGAQISELQKLKPRIIIGGPPCQGFSQSNIVARDPKDPRNSLFKEFLRFVESLRPPLCLIENVKGLLGTFTDSGVSVLDLIHRCFEDLGYDCHSRLLDAVHFGVPQKRERLFIVAVDSELKCQFRWPRHSHSFETSVGISEAQTSFEHLSLPKAVSLWDAISDLPQQTFDVFDASVAYRSDPVNAYQALLRVDAPPVIYNHEPMRHTNRIVERFAHIGYGESEEHSPLHLKPRRRGNANLPSTSVYSQNSRRQRPDQPCNTIVASSHTNYIHPFLNRNFTVREMARIQSFPDAYRLLGKRAVLSKKLSEKKGLHSDVFLDQRMQIGNAVPPLLSKAIAEEMMNTLLQADSVVSSHVA